jgi:hypothetical protein
MMGLLSALSDIVFGSSALSTEMQILCTLLRNTGCMVLRSSIRVCLGLQMSSIGAYGPGNSPGGLLQLPSPLPAP